MSNKDKKQKSTGPEKPIKRGRATFLGVLPDDHPIYRSGTRVGFRSGPPRRPEPEQDPEKPSPSHEGTE